MGFLSIQCIWFYVLFSFLVILLFVFLWLKLVNWFDLLVLDQHMGTDIKGTDVARFARSSEMNSKAIIVICTADNELDVNTGNKAFNLHWTKPAPSVEEIKWQLCSELLNGPSKKLSSSISMKSLDSAARSSSIASSDSLLDIITSSNGRKELSSKPAIMKNEVINMSKVDNSLKNNMQLQFKLNLLKPLFKELNDMATFIDLCNLFVDKVPKQIEKLIDLVSKPYRKKVLNAELHALKGTFQVFRLEGPTIILQKMNQRNKEFDSSTKLDGSDDTWECHISEELKLLAHDLRISLSGVEAECKTVLSFQNSLQT